MSKSYPKQAPLQRVLVITEPWERVAFDIVGPLPRVKDGSKYILISICSARNTQRQFLSEALVLRLLPKV